MELTAGTFYEQFGSGFVLRTYEERSLGIDNSLLGGRLKVNPLPGVFVKAWQENNDDIGSTTMTGLQVATWN